MQHTDAHFAVRDEQRTVASPHEGAIAQHDHGRPADGCGHQRGMEEALRVQAVGFGRGNLQTSAGPGVEGQQVAHEDHELAVDQQRRGRNPCSTAARWSTRIQRRLPSKS